jgi:hypothetical protein
MKWKRAVQRLIDRGLVGRVLVVGVIVACASWPVFRRLSTLPPPIIGQNCGSVHMGFPVAGDPTRPENCLWNAWTRCQTATLVYSFFDVDEGETHTITVQPAQNGCGVRDAVQSHSSPVGGSAGPVTTYTCAGLERSADGGLVVRACGEEGDLKIPPKAPPTPAVPQRLTPTASPTSHA